MHWNRGVVAHKPSPLLCLVEATFGIVRDFSFLVKVPLQLGLRLIIAECRYYAISSFSPSKIRATQKKLISHKSNRDVASVK